MPVKTLSDQVPGFPKTCADHRSSSCWLFSAHSLPPLLNLWSSSVCHRKRARAYSAPRPLIATDIRARSPRRWPWPGLVNTARARRVDQNKHHKQKKNELFSRPLVLDTTFNDIFGARLMATWVYQSRICTTGGLPVRPCTLPGKSASSRCGNEPKYLLYEEMKR